MPPRIPTRITTRITTRIPTHIASQITTRTMSLFGLLCSTFRSLWPHTFLAYDSHDSHLLKP
jgi:hypothetical protein